MRPVQAQSKMQYPDSLKGFVLKVEPASFLYYHLTAGFELPMKKNKFFELNLGFPGVGITNGEIGKGGFLFRSGIKFPVLYTTPFSIIYLMPEIALSRFNILSYDYNTYNNDKIAVNSKALLFTFGYRHVNPISGFYYDAGLSLGYGSSDHPMGSNSLLFTIGSDNYYDYYSSTPSSISGMAFSAKLALGIVIKRSTRK